MNNATQYEKYKKLNQGCLLKWYPFLEGNNAVVCIQTCGAQTKSINPIFYFVFWNFTTTTIQYPKKEKIILGFPYARTSLNAFRGAHMLVRA